MDLATFVQSLVDDGTIGLLAGNVRAQFGPQNRQYIGATVLPERQVPDNRGEEAQIRYRSVIANDGTRYSPVQLKTSGQLVGSFSYELGHQDIGAQLDSRDYDALLQLLNTQSTQDAIATMVRFVDNSVVSPLVEVIEKQRWQALVDAQVTRVGDNGVSEIVDYPDPDGHRVAAGGDWWDDAYDPIDDIFGVNDMLEDKGMRLSRMIAGRRIVTQLSRNLQVRRRYAGVRVLSDADLFDRLSPATVNQGLVSDGLPPIETYDLSYNTQDGSRLRFMPDDVLVFLCETPRDEEIIEPEQQGGEVYRTLENTLGYTGIGRAAGQSTSGRVVYTESYQSKPPRIEVEGWQTSLPIIAEPEAVAVITGINPAG